MTLNFGQPCYFLTSLHSERLSGLGVGNITPNNGFGAVASDLDGGLIVYSVEDGVKIARKIAHHSDCIYKSVVVEAAMGGKHDTIVSACKS